MIKGLILHDGDYRHETLVVRSEDKRRYIEVYNGSRRDILRYAEENNIEIVY